MIDVFSQTWVNIDAWARKALERATNEIESSGLDLAGTEYQRGRIAVLRELLDHAVPKPAIEAEPTTYY